MSTPALLDLLRTLVQLDGSDLHITTATPPQVRVKGHLQRLPFDNLGPAETKQLIYSVLTDAQKKTFEETQELDFSFGITGVARFRGVGDFCLREQAEDLDRRRHAGDRNLQQLRPAHPKQRRRRQHRHHRCERRLHRLGRRKSRAGEWW